MPWRGGMGAFMHITMAHGGGGSLMEELVQSVFQRHFDNGILRQMEDAAVLDLPSRRVAFTTDSFVVQPLFFPGGDIGRLSVCGTVNDLLMRGASPRYLSAGFILQEGLPMATLEKVAASMGAAAREVGGQIVAGDTKVVEGNGGLFINTAGIGVLETEHDISASRAMPGDAVLISGPLGNHHAAILSARMGIENSIQSDCAPLTEMVRGLLFAGLPVHALRDITRGGLATVLHEIAAASGAQITLDGNVPLADDQVQGFADILGLDPLYMGNEGKLALILPETHAKKALEILRASKYGDGARLVGRVLQGDPCVTVQTRGGGHHILSPLAGEGLPRIC